MSEMAETIKQNKIRYRIFNKLVESSNNDVVAVLEFLDSDELAETSLRLLGLF